MATEHEIRELIISLSRQLARIQANAAFLALKREEMRHGSWLSYLNIIELEQNHFIEENIMAGHAAVLKNMLSSQRITLDETDSRLIEEVFAYLNAERRRTEDNFNYPQRFWRQ